MAQTATFTQVEKLEEIAAQNASLLALQRSSSAGALVGRTGQPTPTRTARRQTGARHLGPARQRHRPRPPRWSAASPSPMGRITEVASTPTRPDRLPPPPAPPPSGDPTPEELLPMLRSMFSAISGLRAHQTKMDVTGNNIANVNTVGFKGSQTVFQDTLSQVIRAGGAPAADRGGTNPAQVGLGVKVAGDHHQLDPGRHPDHRPLDRLHDRGRRLLRDPRGHRAALHPRRLVRLRRRRQARHARRRDPAGLDGRRERRRQHQRPDRATCRCPTARSSAPKQTTAGSVEGNLPAGRGHRRRRSRPASRCTTARASRRRSTTTSPRQPRADDLDPRRPARATATQPGHRRARSPSTPPAC